MSPPPWAPHTQKTDYGKPPPGPVPADKSNPVTVMFAGNVQVQLFITDVEPVTKQVQVRKLSLRTYAVVANLAELSPAPCVVAVVTFGRAGVTISFSAVRLVFVGF